MGEKYLKQYLIYHECCLTSKIITSSQLSKFPKLGLKCNLPRLQSPVCPPIDTQMMKGCRAIG